MLKFGAFRGTFAEARGNFGRSRPNSGPNRTKIGPKSARAGLFRTRPGLSRNRLSIGRSRPTHGRVRAAFAGRTRPSFGRIRAGLGRQNSRLRSVLPQRFLGPTRAHRQFQGDAMWRHAWGAVAPALTAELRSSNHRTFGLKSVHARLWEVPPKPPVARRPQRRPTIPAAGASAPGGDAGSRLRATKSWRRATR